MGMTIEAACCPVCGGEVRKQVGINMMFDAVMPEEFWGKAFKDFSWTGPGSLIMICGSDGRHIQFNLCSERCAKKFPELYTNYVEACNANEIERELRPVVHAYGSEAPNWIRKLRKLGIRAQGHAQPGKVTMCDVYHDDTCAALHGGTCNCDPDIKLTTK